MRAPSREYSTRFNPQRLRHAQCDKSIQDSGGSVMIRIKKIVVPVDFSKASKKAVNYALSFALQFDSRLILAHIAPFDNAAYDKAKTDLLALIPPEYCDRIIFEPVVKCGDVQAELLGIIQDKEPDLVVMGTHGRSYVERLLLGSVTESLLRKLHVPILTVSNQDREKEVHKIDPVPVARILYATDLTDGSEDGLEFSIRLAHGLDASLMVSHVVRFADTAFYGLDAAGLMPECADEARAETQEKLSRMVALVSDGSVPILTLLADGIPYETIDRIAVEYKADLIVLNLQNKGRLERVMLGTTAERVIRTATVPVLSLPLPAVYRSHWAAA
jgi:nucleotide-binding universal stress UspA family protein